MIAAHPSLDLTGHEPYDPETIQQTDNDLMKSFLSTPFFPLLNSMRSSDRLMAFEEILASSVDVDEYYLRFKDDGLKNTLNPLDLGLVLAGQSIGILANVIAEFGEASRHTKMQVEPTEVIEQVGTTTDVDVQIGVG